MNLCKLQTFQQQKKGNETEIITWFLYAINIVCRACETEKFTCSIYYVWVFDWFEHIKL